MELDPKKYPTLATYDFEQIREAVRSLIEKGFAENETQALNNLEMDLTSMKLQANESE